jgi:glycosyltransferase involved in cell wall biosynthesis
VAVHSHPHGANLCYCHTIPRFAFDLRQYYLESLPRWQRPALRTLIAYVRPRYREAMQRMDLIMASSQNVRRRIEHHVGLPAQVVYPPVDVDRFRWLRQGDYYLSTARLEPYKRVDRIVEAFRQLPEKRLIVTSGGSQLGELKRLAKRAGNIELTGWTDEETLRDLLGGAIATLYVARDEDFGMSPVESLAAGKPVIGVAEGGLLETLTDRVTGILLPPDPSAADVAEAVRWLTPERAAPMRESCEKHASRFHRSRFLALVRDLLAETLAADRSGSARMAGPVASRRPVR